MFEILLFFLLAALFFAYGEHRYCRGRADAVDALRKSIRK